MAGTKITCRCEWAPMCFTAQISFKFEIPLCRFVCGIEFGQAGYWHFITHIYITKVKHDKEGLYTVCDCVQYRVLCIWYDSLMFMPVFAVSHLNWALFIMTVVTRFGSVLNLLLNWTENKNNALADFKVEQCLSQNYYVLFNYRLCFILREN